MNGFVIVKKGEKIETAIRLCGKLFLHTTEEIANRWLDVGIARSDRDDYEVRPVEVIEKDLCKI